MYNLHGVGTHTINDVEVVINLRELKKKIYLCVVSVNVLEAIRFYISFACSFAFAERELMEGNAKIIKLIARDEALHLVGTQHLINILANGDEGEEWESICSELKPEVTNIFKDAAEQEIEWTQYLFKDGSILGLNEKVLTTYIKYITNLRMEAIGLPVLYPTARANPIPWINAWLSSDNVQVAPQETEITSYLVGQVLSDLGTTDLSGYSL